MDFGRLGYGLHPAPFPETVTNEGLYIPTKKVLILLVTGMLGPRGVDPKY